MELLSKKVVLITGAGGGLGRAYASAVADQGGRVVVFDVNPDGVAETVRLIEDSGGEALGLVGSVAEAEQVEEAVDAGLARWGRLDGVVNNAGINYEAYPWEETAEQLRRIVDINVLGVLLTGTIASRHLGPGSAIVNISSGASFGSPRDSSYAATKGAVASVTYSWAIDLESRGVRVNALSPLAYTSMAELPIARDLVPKDRRPELIAPVLVWLLSDRAAGVTGQFFRFSGNDLHVVGQPFVKEPVVHRDSWAVQDVDAAMRDTLVPALEAYGLARTLPPILREPME